MHRSMLIALVALATGLTSTTATAGATVTVSPVDPLSGSFSMRVEANGGPRAFVELSQQSLSSFTIAFEADFANIASQSDVAVPVLALIDNSNEQPLRFRLLLVQDGVVFSDGMETSVASVYADQLAPGKHDYELSINVATGAVLLRVDGVVAADFSHDFGATVAFNRLRMGLTATGVPAGTLAVDNVAITLSGQPAPTFFDDFETGDFRNWSATVP